MEVMDYTRDKQQRETAARQAANAQAQAQAIRRSI